MGARETLLPIEFVTDGPYAGVVTLTLEQDGRPVVVLDHDLLTAIDVALDAIEERYPEGMTGLVLASAAPRSFVAGANLKEIMELDDSGLHSYLRYGARVFNRFATMPVTTVAAINNAALGGGLELAMHCDILIGAAPGEKPYPVGLPEAGLKISPGWGGTNLLPARMDPKEAIVATATGTPMKADAAHEAGVLSELVEGDLLERARQLALAPKKHARSRPVCIGDEEHRAKARKGLVDAREDLEDKDPARAVMACVHTGVESGWDDAIAMERDELVRLRSTDEGKAAIEAFFAKK